MEEIEGRQKEGGLRRPTPCTAYLGLLLLAQGCRERERREEDWGGGERVLFPTHSPHILGEGRGERGKREARKGRKKSEGSRKRGGRPWASHALRSISCVRRSSLRERERRARKKQKGEESGQRRRAKGEGRDGRERKEREGKTEERQERGNKEKEEKRETEERRETFSVPRPAQHLLRPLFLARGQPPQLLLLVVHGLEYISYYIILYHIILCYISAGSPRSFCCWSCMAWYIYINMLCYIILCYISAGSPRSCCCWSYMA
jgi:hypothetical protein